MRTLLAIALIVAAASLAWGRSEHERAIYFATRADSWQVAYEGELWQSEQCVVDEDGAARPTLTKYCFVDLPKEEQ